MVRVNYEYAFLAVFSLVFLLVGFSAFENRLAHPFPTGYFASDAFFHAAESEWMKDSGKVLYVQPSLVGKHTNIYDTHPPFVFEEASLFSFGSGLKVYDAVYALSILSLLLIALVLYAGIRMFSRGVAMLSLPVTLLVFSPPFNQMINFGQWLFIPGALFMLAVFWAVPRIGWGGWYVPIGILFAGLAIAHQPELLFAAGFLFLYFALSVVRERRLRGAEVKHAALSGAVALPLAAFSFYIFALTMLQTEEIIKPVKKDFLFFTFDPGVAEKGFANIDLVGSFGTWGWPLFFLILGGVALFLVSRAGGRAAAPASPDSGAAFLKSWAGIVGLYMLIVGYSTLVGLGKRAFAHRWLWHFYLAFFVGLALYQLVRMLAGSAQVRVELKHVSALSVVLLLVFAQPVFGKVKGSIMDPYNWDALMWLRQNTPEDIDVHYFFVNYLEQTPTIYNSRRMAFLVNYPQYFQDARSGALKPEYRFGSTFAYASLMCRIAPFNPGYYNQLIRNDTEPCDTEGGLVMTELPSTQVRLCDIDYYYFNKLGYDEPSVRHNLVVQEQLLTNPWVKEVYSNPLVSILKNEKPGEDCLGQPMG